MEISWEKQEQEIRGWIGALLENIDKHVDEETKAKIFEGSGRNCARNHTVAMFQKLWKDTQDLEKFVGKIDKAMGAETQWELKGNELHIAYGRCFCYLPVLKLVNTPSLCHCSPGWIKENLEMALGKPIEVERVYTVHRPTQEGDKGCKFIARL
ncbi:MAG: hypothetical protein ACXADX_19235 [Candidatus Hodarchaeales archaeon]|jgi:predicted hydrocarbon binding protein